MTVTPFNPPRRARSVISPHARIQSALRDKLLMGALLHDRTMVDDENAIRIHDG